MKFLRYNSRHCLWFPRGYEGKWFPQLNPIASCSHGANKKPTKYMHEPQWLWRLRRKLFGFAGNQVNGPHHGEAIWARGPDGYRTCSMCGSLHFDDFMDICKRANADPRFSVEPSDKRYKIYVKQPGVRNASEGAIKFYTDHLPEGRKLTDEEQKVYGGAVRLSSERFEERMKQHYKDIEAKYGNGGGAKQQPQGT